MSRKWGLKTILFKLNNVLCVCFLLYVESSRPQTPFQSRLKRILVEACPPSVSNTHCIHASKQPGSTENVLDSNCAEKPGPLLKSIMTSALLNTSQTWELYFKDGISQGPRRVSRRMPHELVYYSQRSINSQLMNVNWSAYREGHVVTCAVFQ